MSFKSGISLDNSNLKFLELKKYAINGLNGTAVPNGVQCLAVDNQRQTVFAINGSQLSVIPLTELLAFEWNRSVINETSTQLPGVSVELNFRAHFISLSAAGFGQKLAVCGTDGQTNSPFIMFYDLNEIYRNQSKSCPYNRVNLANSTGLVTDIVWHPEISDDLFGCCVADGSLYIISIGDASTKSSTIMADIRPMNGSHPLSMCWSPKGKQLVVGHKNGFFSQYKLNTTAGHPLQEVKKTPLMSGLQDYHVIAIKWIVSSLFAVAICKDNPNDRDTHFLLVSTPTKAQPVFVDFGCVCLDNYDVQDSY
ncbi:unnamed protein product, partial [Medioppia subpectinata]